MGAATTIEILLQQSTQLRAKAPLGLRAGAARPVCAAHQRSAESDISSPDQISWADAAGTGFKAVSKRGSALISVIPTEVACRAVASCEGWEESLVFLFSLPCCPR